MLFCTYLNLNTVQCHIHTTGPSLPGHLLFPIAHYSSINRCHHLCWLLCLCKDSFSLQRGDVACWAWLRTLQRGNHITGTTEQHPQPLGSTGDSVPSNWGTDPTYLYQHHSVTRDSLHSPPRVHLLLFLFHVNHSPGVQVFLGHVAPSHGSFGLCCSPQVPWFEGLRQRAHTESCF